MNIAESKITAQGQISGPAKVRKALGLAPGAIIEWHEFEGEIVVRRGAEYTSVDIHRALFPTAPEVKSKALSELDAAIRL